MSTFIPLESLEIATPCRADWNKMQGDDRARFCATCAKHVYNLSEMTRAESDALIRFKEGNLCVRMLRRADGTVITGDCPIGMKFVRRSFKWTATTFMLLLAPLLTLGTTLLAANPKTKQLCSTGLRNVQPFKSILNQVAPQTYGVAGGVRAPIMGAPVPPPPTPAPPSTGR
jgi:hypothetical protein